MKITGDKKRQILADHSHLSVHEISKKYNLPKNEIKKIIQNSEKKTPKWFFAVLALIPVLFVVLLELLLRIFNYGQDIPQWADAGNGKYIINPEIGKRYFNDIQFTAATNEDVFDQQKKGNAYRIFILGESSAAGYPFMPMGSFSRYIRKRLEMVYPNTAIEVVNLGMTGVCSYTILDLIPGVLEQKPDLILIYTGHNEYYGALGVGSAESLGASRSMVNLILYLNKYKITQLLRNSIKWTSSLFKSENKKETPGTLMSRLAEDQYIPINSEKFNAGIDQFSGNLSEILDLVKKKGVPVIIGRLVSNLKDQKPFISLKTVNYKTADIVFEEAQLELKNNHIPKADSLFRLAKDLDVLRFRAPEKINEVINEAGKRYNAEIVSLDSLFDSVSPLGITGNNLMVDHLHPNLKGYQLIGKSFYEAMAASGNLPKTEDPKISFSVQDSITRANFVFTELDSIIGNNIVTLLKNDWPFVEKRNSRLAVNLFKQDNFLDSIAVKYIEKKISWADAHIEAAVDCLIRDDIANHLKYMNALIYQYPSLNDYNSALKYFYERNMINPKDFTAKRIGRIALYNKDYDNAVTYLNRSIQTNPKDAEVLNNLAEAYLNKKDFKKAYDAIVKCLAVDPHFPGGGNLKQQILDSIRVHSKN